MNCSTVCREVQQIQQSRKTFTTAFLACRLKANTVSNAVLNLDLLQQQIYHTSKPTYNTELPYALPYSHGILITYGKNINMILLIWA